MARAARLWASSRLRPATKIWTFPVCFSPHMDGRQSVHVAGLDRRHDALDDILVDRRRSGWTLIEATVTYSGAPHNPRSAGVHWRRNGGEPRRKLVRGHPECWRDGERARRRNHSPFADETLTSNEKGRLERAIRYVRDNFFAARIFADLDDLNVVCLMLLLDVTIVGGKLVC
jgi:hypothetical protein